MPLNQIYNQSILMGSDPELFFSKNGKIIGSEKVIPAKGLTYLNKNKYGETGGFTSPDPTVSPKIIRDGIQIEVNPRPNTCRANIINELKHFFFKIKELSEKKQINPIFNTTVKITKREMKSLSDKSKIFGCAPSENIYGMKGLAATIDASKYYKRSAGGHIHIGCKKNDEKNNPGIDKPEILVPLLDLILANTCVLIDRDHGNKERRKYYGLAGEFRKPGPGRLEYRTLSNFWLKNPTLMSMVFGITRQVVTIANYNNPEIPNNNYFNELFSVINKEDVIKAINTNNKKLALQNFKKIKPILKEISNYSSSLNKENIPYIEYFISKPLSFWFKDDPITAWTNVIEGHAYYGWESFLEYKVRPLLLNQN